jgi:hypothetical protein
MLASTMQFSNTNQTPHHTRNTYTNHKIDNLMSMRFEPRQGPDFHSVPEKTHTKKRVLSQDPTVCRPVQPC